MSLERNKNLDIVRAIATLLVVIYHSWVLAGQADFRMPFVRVVIPLGGELGVTSFFLLSGYGIYCSIYNTEGKESVKFLAFMQKRLLASSGFSGVYTQLFLSVLNVNVYKISLRKCAVRSNFDFSVFPHTSSMLVIGFSKDGRIM